MKKLLLAIAMTAISTGASAMSYAQLQKDKAAGGNMWLFTLMYVKGLGQGYVVANGMLEERGSKPFYRPPETVALNQENYIDLIETTAGKLRAAGRKVENEKFGVEELLMLGLQTTFPCSQR
jgi:hypothetical protein